jgi:hypothetical protein
MRYEPQHRIEHMYARGQRADTILEREAILRVLEDRPEEFSELRGVLLREHEWRRREGL